MSTRSTTWFVSLGVPEAKVYRHSDGYPEGHGVDLQRFFSDVEEQTRDTRYTDPTYLAAKLVVWLAGEFSAPGSLDFLGVGIVQEDPSDVEYVYVIDCDALGEDGRPKVTCHHAVFSTSGALVGAIVGIPAPDSPKERLEYLRQELRAERLSWGDVHELQSLAGHIEPGDVELLEAAGVPEFPAAPLVIRREFHGGSEDQTFEDFAASTIQERGVALEVARAMLDGRDPYDYNADEPEFLETFTILDREALRATVEALEARDVQARESIQGTRTVFVVAFQHRTPGEGVGGFDWRETRAEVEAIELERERSGFYGPEYEHAVFPFDVPVGLGNDETTEYVDAEYIDALRAALEASEGVN